LPPLSSPGVLPPRTRWGREAFANRDMGPQGGGCSPAGHALGRLPAGACPRLIRANDDHRPGIHSPQRHPLRTAGFQRPAPSESGRDLPPSRVRPDRDRSVVRTCEEDPRKRIASTAARRRPAVQPVRCPQRGPVAGRGAIEPTRPRASCSERAHPAAPILGQPRRAPGSRRATVLFAAPGRRGTRGPAPRSASWRPRSRTSPHFFFD